VIGRVVAIGGPPGSGKSTAGRLLAGSLGLEYRSAGEVFRAEAAERRMDVETFGQFAEAHPEIDRKLDDLMQSLARPGVLLDGRIQGVLSRRHGIPVHAIVVTAAESERARRVAARDGQPLQEALQRIRWRTESERRRYHALYGIEIDTEAADLTVDSTSTPAPAVADEIARYLRSKDGERSP
jgi:cytidylate kinase